MHLRADAMHNIADALKCLSGSIPGLDLYGIVFRVPLQDLICGYLIHDYSSALLAACPDFESHHSGEREPHIPVIQIRILVPVTPASEVSENAVPENRKP